MAIDFPPTPTVGQEYVYGSLSWTWTGQYWNSAGGSGGSGGGCTADSIPPPSPAIGDLWYDTTNGRMYIWYDSTWSEVTGASGAVNAADLLGTTLAPGVVNASLRNVTSTGTLTLSGGAGAITQVLAPGAAGALVLQAASESMVYIDSTGIYLQPNAGDRLYLGGRAGFMPIGVYGANGVDLTVTATPQTMMTVNVPMKTGDVAIIHTLEALAGNGSGLIYGNVYVGAGAISNAAPMVHSGNFSRTSFVYYTAPSDGTVAFLWKVVLAGGAFTTLGSYSFMMVELWGAR